MNPSVLLYTRPRIDGFYHALVREWLGTTKYTSMSDHRGLEPVWLMDHFYRAMRDRSARFGNIPLDLDDYHSIILRCRYLRHIPFSDAIRHVNAMWIAVERIYETVQPDIILGPVMDSYVLDICDRVARQYDHEYSGFLENMINGYCRITSRGELRSYREPTDDEVENAYQMLHQRTYVPKMQRDGMASVGSVHRRMRFYTKYLREQAKRAYYGWKRMSDPCNFYYNTVAAAKVGIACGSIAHLDYEKYEASDWHERISTAKANGARVIYLPLQFYPEASIDYWGTSLEFAQFDSITFRLLRAANPGNLVVVKEHPSMTTFRHPDFYDQIRRLPNVVLAPVSVPSNTLLDMADVVITWTGSVGFEAAIRDLPLVTLGRAYYDTKDVFLAVEDPAELDDLSALSHRAETKHRSAGIDAQPHSLIREMLRGLLPGYVFSVDFAGSRIKKDEAELKRLGRSLDAYYSSIGTNSHPVHPRQLRDCGVYSNPSQKKLVA